MTAAGGDEWECLQIGLPDLTIDCNGYGIRGYDLPGVGPPEFGIYAAYGGDTARTTIKNCMISGFNMGVALYSSLSSMLTGNTVRANRLAGIYLSSSGQSTLMNNRANSNAGRGILLSYSPNCTVDGNAAESNSGSSGSGVGIEVSGSNSVTLSKNQVNLNDTGIILSGSSSSLLNDNTINSSKNYGVRLYNSSSNTLRGNVVSGNALYEAITLSSSQNNRIFDNLFGHRVNFYVSPSSNTWNTVRTPGTNVVGGGYLGGNFWTNPSGSGFSDTCSDNDYDGICDLSYTLATNNIDYLPLTRPAPPNTPQGDNVLVTDPDTGAQITFSQVITQGMTTVTPSDTGPPTPDGFLLVSVYFDIETTAVFNGSIEVCLPYDRSEVTSEENLRLMHSNGTAWEDVTTSVDTANEIVCGRVSNFSIFAVMESIREVEARIDFDPDTLNLASKGKWVTVYIEIPGAYDLLEIVVSSIRLNGSVPAEQFPTAVGDFDNDGVMDLMVKFSRSAVQEALSPGVNVITVSGKLSNDTVFSGTDQ